MTSPNEEPPFDEEPISAQLIGTWSYPRTEEPSEIDYLHFHESGLAFQLFRIPPRLDKLLPVRMRYSIESHSRIRVRNIKGGQTGWTKDYRLEGNTLTITKPMRAHVCIRVAPEDVPEWFREGVGKYL